MTHPFAKLLTEARRSSGMSVLELADRAGYCESLFEKLECGQRSLTFGSLMAWSEALGYEVTVKRKDE